MRKRVRVREETEKKDKEEGRRKVTARWTSGETGIGRGQKATLYG